MKHLYTIAAILSIAFLASCEPNKATIHVTNNIKNIKLEQISFGENIRIISSLLPGEFDSKVIKDNNSSVNFPMTEQIRFYMVKGDNQVLLYTKESYTIDKEQELRIILTDDTEVVNPMNPISSRIVSIKEIDVLQPEE